jgi:hypothetical protein
MDFSPAAISNIGFLVIGLYLIFVNRREQPSYLSFIGPLSVAVGTSSFIYHLHPTLISKLIDLSVIFLFLSFLVTINLYRLRHAALHPKKLIGLYIASNVATIILLYFTRLEAGVWLFVIYVVLAALTEFLLLLKTVPRYNLILFALAIAILAIAWQLRMIESITVLSWTIIVSGHAVWHGLVSLCFLLIYYFHRRLRHQ